MTKKFIQKALRKHRKGALHRELGYAPDEVIPVLLLESIKETPVGHKVFTNGKNRKTEWVKVTRLLKRRASLALTLRRFK